MEHKWNARTLMDTQGTGCLPVLYALVFMPSQLEEDLEKKSHIQ